MKQSFADILRNIDLAAGRKLAVKMPEWTGVGGLVFPSALALEQCSSTAAAIYKAGLAAGCRTVCDITGGLGVDSWAFAAVVTRVLYFEKDKELCAAAGNNFALLGRDNVEVFCEEVTPSTGLPECDLFYADPARRDACGRKVFLLEDSSPDILTLLPLLFEKAPRVMLKLSPMADISMVAARLGGHMEELHVVCLNGEVKELLCLLDRDLHSEEYRIRVCDLSSRCSRLLDFSSDEVLSAEAGYATELHPGELILEPYPGVLKSGAFNLLCGRFGVRKLSRDVHLYTCGGLNPDPAVFKAFDLLEVLPLDGATLKQVRRRWPRSEVTARGIPMKSDELRSRLGVASGGDIHLFGCAFAGRRVLLVTRAVSRGPYVVFPGRTP